MFIEKLSRTHIEKGYLPPFSETISFVKTKEKGGYKIFYSYKLLAESTEKSLEFSDFSDGTGNVIKYARFMYNIFGDEYKEAFTNRLANTIFNT